MTYRTRPLTSAESRAYDTWAPQGACRGKGPDPFFARARVLEAKAICAPCPVRLNCLSWALKTDQAGGVWGGLSEQERRRTRVDSAA
jgi:WhiB family redox-sensing transcriptional regulator